MKIIEKNHSQDKIIVFCNTKSGCALLDGVLGDALQMPVGTVHGDVAQNARERALNFFRTPGPKLLICTDVYARGLDVSDVTLVINYEMPNDIESYVHRIGRTARGRNATGTALSLLSPADVSAHRRRLLEILKDAKQPIPEELMTSSSRNEGFFEAKSDRGGRDRFSRF